METTSSSNVVRSSLPYESASMLAAWETDPTPVVTRSSDVRLSCVESTSSMVLRSHIRGGHSSAAIADVEVRPEIEFRQEAEINNPAEIRVSMNAICVGGSGTTRLDIPERVSKYVTKDSPETTAAFPASQEVLVESNPNYANSPNPIPHT